ncbi:MAG: hypothetical protein F4X92_00325 [Gammaproteobacteria bacterium]|nr:hypothetical protein [Gammaproteobacteria bacterium]
MVFNKSVFVSDRHGLERGLGWSASALDSWVAVWCLVQAYRHEALEFPVSGRSREAVLAGKLKTVFQMTSILLLLYAQPVHGIPDWGGSVLRGGATDVMVDVGIPEVCAPVLARGPGTGQEMEEDTGKNA